MSGQAPGGRRRSSPPGRAGAAARRRAPFLLASRSADDIGRNGVYGNLASGQPLPTFGQPLAGIAQTEPGRQFQFELRVIF